MCRATCEIYVISKASRSALRENLKSFLSFLVISWLLNVRSPFLQVNGSPTFNYQPTNYPQSWHRTPSCPNGLCHGRTTNRRSDLYDVGQQTGPVFVGGSFDFDLNQLSQLIEPVFNMLKNSEIIKVGTGSGSSRIKDSEEDPGNHRQKRPPLITFGVPEVHFVNPHLPIQPMARPDFYHTADSNTVISSSVKRKKSKKRKKPSRSKLPPLISFVDDDEEDEMKKADQEEDEEKNEEDEDKKDLEQLLELGLPKIIMDELFGFGRGLVRPGKILTHLTFASIARGVLKRFVKSMFWRMAPRFGRRSIR